MFALWQRIKIATRALLIVAVLFNALAPTDFVEAKTESVLRTETNSQVTGLENHSTPEQSKPETAEPVSDSISDNTENDSQVSNTVQNATQPIIFFENVGQYDSRALFVAQGKGSTIFLARNEIWFTFTQSTDKYKEKPGQVDPDDLRKLDTNELVDIVNLRLNFPGSASKVRVEGFNKLDMQVSRFSGSNSSIVYQDIPVWGGVRYVDLYPGADLEITSLNGELTWQIVVKDSSKFSSKGSSITRQGLSIKFAGHKGLSVLNGKMSVNTDLGEYFLPQLKVAGAMDKTKIDQLPTVQGDQLFLIPSSASSINSSHSGLGVMATVAANDLGQTSNQAESEDPTTILFKTIFGGHASTGNDQTLGPDGHVFVTGVTCSTDFPSTTGHYQESLLGENDAFVAKFDSIDGHMIWATYLGGTDGDTGLAIQVTNNGEVYVAGSTVSADFPIIGTPVSSTPAENGFLAQLNANGTALLYSAYVGYGDILDMVVRNADNVDIVYMLGSGPGTDVTAFKLVPGNVDYEYSYSLGNYVWSGMALDTNGSAYFVGFKDDAQKDEEVIVISIDNNGVPQGSPVTFGGNSRDRGNGITVDTAGNIYVTGWTNSENFPLMGNSLTTRTPPNGSDIFVTILNPDGTLHYSSVFDGEYIGENGSEWEYGQGIAVDLNGVIYIAGMTIIDDESTKNYASAIKLTPYDTLRESYRVATKNLVEAQGLGWNYSPNASIDTDGNIYITGDVSLPDGSGRPFGDDEAFLVKISTAYDFDPTTFDPATDVPPMSTVSGGHCKTETTVNATVGADGTFSDISCTQKSSGDPINIQTGAFSFTLEDLSFSTTAGDLVFQRSYSSGAVSAINTLGYGWTHNHDVRLIFPDDSRGVIGYIAFQSPLGNQYLFKMEADGSFTPGPGVIASLTKTSTAPVTYTITDSQQAVFRFDESGRLTEHQDAQGHAFAYEYDLQNPDQLIKISADGGMHFIQIDYDDMPDHLTVSDHENRQVSYYYDGNGDLVSFIDVMGRTWTYTYDSGHHMIQAEDPDGKETMSTVYDERGRAYRQYDEDDNLLLSITYNDNGNTIVRDALGHEEEYQYNERNAVTQITDPVNRTEITVFDEDSNNFRPEEIRNSANQTLQMEWSTDGVNLISKTDPAGNKTEYTYDSLNNLTSVKDARQFTTSYEYNGKLLTKVTDALDGETTYTYTPEGFLESVTDTAGRETSYTYNSFGQRLTMTDPNGKTWSYTYDSLGRLIDTTDPRNRVTHNEYNLAGKLVHVTQNYSPARLQNAENQYNIVTTYAYDARGNQTAVTDTYNRTTQYVYDNANRLVQTIDPLGNTTTNTYDATGHLVSTTDPLGNETTYEYDAAGRLIRTINALNQPSAMTTFDVSTNTSTVTDPLERATVFHYDELGRVIQVVDPLGNSTTTTYDPNGNVATRTDQLGRTTFYQYDELNRLVKTTDPNGGETETFYDEDGNRIATEDPLNHRTEYTYDDIGRLIATTDPLDRTTQTVYDEYSRRVATIDAAGHQITYTYDMLDRVITVTDDDGNATHTTYDALGNVLTSTDANGHTTTTVYDAINRPWTVTDAEGNTTTNTYDAAGNLIEVRDALGHTTHYTYDELNRQIAVTDPLEHATQSHYDALGNLLEKVDANGVVTRHEYDELNRQTAVVLNYKLGVNPDAETNIRYEFVYNEVGNRISVEDPRGKITTYGYDALNRLIEKKGPLQNTWSYTYDLAGNRISATDAKNQTIQYTYDAANQLIGIDYPGTEPDVTFAYSLTGQRTSMTDGLGTTTWVYNDLDRLTSVTDAFEKTIDYGYDAVGNRIGLTYPDDKTVTYTYDKNNHLESVTDWDQQETEYSYNEVGQLASVSRPNGVSSQYVYDNAGRLEELDHTFGSNTLASYNYTYDPAGNRTRAIENLQNPQMASANPGGFAGLSGQPSQFQGVRSTSADVIALKPPARDEALFIPAYQIDPTETPTETSTLTETPMDASTATATPVATLPASQPPDASESSESLSDESNLVDNANLPAPPSQIDTKRTPVGAGVVDDADSAWKYVGTWTASKNAASDRGTLHRTTTSGNYAELTFTGTQFTLTLAKDSKGGSIDVYVDGNKVETIDANSPDTLWESTWNSPIFAAGDHTVRLVHAGSSGKFIDIDTIEIENLPMPAATDTTEAAEDSLLPSKERSLSPLQDFTLVSFTAPQVQTTPANRTLFAPVYQQESIMVTEIDARSGQACVITSTGGLKCWGWNAYGQLGDGTTTQRNTPVDVSGLTSEVQAIAMGYYHTCAATSSGGVKCWGQNTAGQLGNGTTTNRSTPADVVGLSDVTALAAGGSHTCALTSSGGVKCWGANNVGQLGDGTTTQRLTPVNVSGLSSGVVALAASGSSTCALTSSGGVKCWGHNSDGQLGDGTTTDRRTPVNVSGLTSGATAITAGAIHMCALTDAGGVKCWGENSMGQLGDGSYADHTTPVSVIGSTSGIVAIDSSHYHNCAITTSGGVRCWGTNSYGQHGNGSLTSGVAVLGIGNAHSCALMNNGGVQCWGDNSNAQLGDGTTTQRLTPVNVSGLTSNAATIVTRYLHTCAITSDGGAKCWSINGNGQLGDGTNTSRTTPVNVSGLTSGVASIATGQYHTCAVTTSGGAKCWGSNGYGQLGQGAVSEGGNTPLNVSGLTSGVTAIATGFDHSCALLTSGGVKCWGKNTNGQVGDGSTTVRAAPVNVNNLTSGVTAIAAGNNHTCAVTSTGGVKCWGNNSHGQLGDGTTTQRLTPVNVSGLTSGVVAISAGDLHTCALTTNGGVKCWGSNGSGRLGDGTYTNSSTPVDVSDLTSGVSVISAGGSHTCAVTSSGIAQCWGNNYFGQLGDGTTTYRNTPVDVSGLAGGATTITAGYSHTCAVTSNGGAKCWGESTSGQLGDGALSYRSAPAYVIGLTGVVCYPLTIGHTGQGSDPLVSPTNSTGCSTGEYVAGESISLSGAIPDSGWEIDSWTGTENDAGTGITNTVTMPASAHSVNVNYIVPSITIDYTYDKLNRLTEATYSDGRSFGYTYDPAGNVLELEQNLGPGTVTTTYTYDDANQLDAAQQGSTTWQYTYDANGSLISDGTKTYTYDSANRLIQVTDQSLVTNLSYNGLGQRLSMDAAGVIAHYVMDGDQPLTADSDDNTTYYLYGLGSIGEKTTVWSYSLPDGTNTPRQLSNNSGAITLAARYTPWGDTLDTYGTGNFTFGYFGGVMDAATGLLYVGNGQYYDPATGRFLTRDAKPNNSNPYVPWDPTGAILGPLAAMALFFGKRKKGSKVGTFLVLALVVGFVGMTLAGCGNITATDIGITPSSTPMPISATVTQTQSLVTAVVSTPTQLVTITAPAPSSTPVYNCPVHIYDYEENEDYKRRIKDDFGIILGGSFYGTEEWPSVHIQIVHGALSRINDALGGNLKSRLGVDCVFHHITSTTGEYGGYARSTNSIEFTVTDKFPYHLIYHEMGHLLDNTQGEKYTSSLETTVVYTNYPDQTGDRVMGGMPYNRIDGKGYVSLGLQDPCGYTVDAELHPASTDGNNSGEEWGDLFANYVSGNFNSLPEGRAKYRWVHDQLFGS